MNRDRCPFTFGNIAHQEIPVEFMYGEYSFRKSGSISNDSVSFGCCSADTGSGVIHERVSEANERVSREDAHAK